MNYRALRPEEFATAHRDLYALMAYHGMLKVARDLYGPEVYRVECEIDGEYDDEGGTDWRITSISAEDSAGNTLYYDISTAWWQQTLSDGYGARYRGEDEESIEAIIAEYGDDVDARHEWLNEDFSDDLYEARREIDVQDWRSVSLKIDVDHPPEVTFAMFYVEDLSFGL